MMAAIEIIRPVPDSHFRLVACGVCGSADAAYERRLGWRVRCQACGHTVDIGTQIRHEAQVAWNEENKYAQKET